MSMFVLFESSIGYALFKLNEFDDVNTTEQKVQKQIANFSTFSKLAHLNVLLWSIKAFYPFESSNIALDIINQTISGKAPEELINFLNESLPIKKKSKIRLGVSDNKLAGAITESL